MEENTEAEEREAPYNNEDYFNKNHDVDIDHLSHFVRAYMKILKTTLNLKNTFNKFQM